MNRLKRYLKFRREFRNEWCTAILDHVPFRSYIFSESDEAYPTTKSWEGSHSGVKFDPYYILRLEDDYAGLCGFYHTHPPHLGEAQPSGTDMVTMDAWVLCLGRPLFCWIDNGWDIACWYFDQYGHFRLHEFTPIEDPLEHEWIRIKR